MILIPSHGRNTILFSLIFLISCQSEFYFDEIDKEGLESYKYDYVSYCEGDLKYQDSETLAVQMSIYGEVRSAEIYAEQRESGSVDSVNNYSHRILDQRFLDAKSYLAEEYICNLAKDYQVVLINEAHYCSQHRNFTSRLLKGLRDIGFSYLALETAAHNDEQKLNKRGYPILNSGYYTKDSHFGNMVRHALELGFRIIAYETQNDYSGTLRDKDQAHNIYNKTLSNDSSAKVIVHAGYSHILETGDDYFIPMGTQLKNLMGQDILTIEQEKMTPFGNSTTVNSYYYEAEKRGLINEEPVVIVDKRESVVVDAISKGSVDLQIYHPRSSYRYGRPEWMIDADMKIVKLPSEILEFDDHLLRALHFDEDRELTVPVDQFLIDKEKRLVLPIGKYRIQIIDCSGNLLREYKLNID